MAYLANFNTISSTAGAATYTVNVPEHRAADIIVVGVSADGGGTLSASWTNAVSGSQVGSTLVSTTNLSTAVFWARATTAAVTASITMGAADAIQTHVFVIRDADSFSSGSVLNASTSSLHAAPGGTDFSFTMPSVTTTTSSCFVLYYIGADSATTTPPSILTHPGPCHFIDSSDTGGGTVTTLSAGAAGWYIQSSAGAVTTPRFEMSSTEITGRFTMAFRNTASGYIPPYIDDVDTLGTKMSFGSWFVATTLRNNEFFSASLNPTNIGPNNAGLATTFDAAASVADAGLNPYSFALNSTPGASTTNAIGFSIDFPTTPINASTGWICGAFMCSTARMSNFTQGDLSQGGTYLVAVSTLPGDAGYQSYRIMSRDNTDGNGTGFTVFSVQPSQTQSRLGFSSGSYTASSLKKIALLHKGQNGTAAYYYCDIHLMQKLTVSGGTRAAPVDTQGLTDVGKYCRLPLVKKSGASGLLSYIPIQIGGGDPVNFNIQYGSLQFPRIFSTASKEVNYHGADGAIGISYAGLAGDTIYHQDSVVSSPSPFYWQIHPSASSAATWSFSGLSIVGANVSLRNVTTFDSMTFSGCRSLNFSGSYVTNAIITGLPTGSNTLIISQSNAVTTSSIDVRGLRTGSFLCTIPTASYFGQCTFVGSSTSGHAMNLNAAGTHSLRNLTFTNFGADNTSASAILNSSGGSIRLEVLGGNTPSYRNTAGSTTTVVNTVSLTINITDATGSLITSACEVTVVKDSDTSVLFQEENVVSGTSQYLYTYTVDTPIYINVLNVASYEPKTVSGISLTNSSQTINVQLDDERGRYSNPT
jgi:hypothetical protein